MPGSYIGLVDHSALLIEYLDGRSPDVPALREEESAPAGADTLPAWGEVAKTEIAAPAFCEVQRQQSIEVDIEVDRFVDGALVECFQDDGH